MSEMKKLGEAATVAAAATAGAAAATASARNPANPLGEPGKDFEVVPMSVPQQKLWAPDIPGYHCHWMRGNRQRIMQAYRAGYTHVSQSEIMEHGGLNQLAVGGEGEFGLGSDMGSHVSIEAGDEFGADGQAERLYLMKVREDLWRKSQAVLEQRNDMIAQAIRGGTMQPAEGSPETDEDQRLRFGGMLAERNATVGIKPRPGTRTSRPGDLFVKKS